MGKYDLLWVAGVMYRLNHDTGEVDILTEGKWVRIPG